MKQNYKKLNLLINKLKNKKQIFNLTKMQINYKVNNIKNNKINKKKQKKKKNKQKK